MAPQEAIIKPIKLPIEIQDTPTPAVVPAVDHVDKGQLPALEDSLKLKSIQENDLEKSLQLDDWNLDSIPEIPQSNELGQDFLQLMSSW